jgi:MerR family copper efflux transcriptional regulator
MRRARFSMQTAEALSRGYYNIGQASEATGVTAKMIRHYESLGLLGGVERTLSNYRIYSERDLHLLRFIRRGRSLGFSMKEIEALLGLWQDSRRKSAEVRRLAQRHVEELDRRIAEMQDMRDSLMQLVEACHGDQRPDCPILEDLGRSR